jgi:two-component system sensor histidine kinase EvgS
MQKRRILVVDDHPLNRLVVAEQIATLGHACVCAKDGEEALALLAAGGVDLVLTDCRMRGMDGFALAARIRDDARARGMEPVAVVGYSGDMTIDATLGAQSGMRCCLSKPLSTPALGDVLDAVFRGEVGTLRPSHEGAQWSLFMRTTATDLAEARAALGDRDEPRLRVALHRIKGAALMLGAAGIATACASAEAAVPDWDPSTLAACIDAIGACVDAADATVSPAGNPGRAARDSV